MSNVGLPEDKHFLISKPWQENHRTRLLDGPLDTALSLATWPTRRDLGPRYNGGVGHGEGPQCEGDVAARVSGQAQGSEEVAFEAVARSLLDHHFPGELPGTVNVRYSEARFFRSMNVNL